MDILKMSLPGIGAPAYLVASIESKVARPKGGAVVLHGYGGCKEDMLGISVKLAERGMTALTLDLRDHGENKMLLGPEVMGDVREAVDWCRRFGYVVAVGHSLGGRLALSSGADKAIAISPALNPEFNDATAAWLNLTRVHRVRPSDVALPYEILTSLPPPTWENGRLTKARVLYGSRDLPEVIQACSSISDPDVIVKEIPGATHADMVSMGASIDAILSMLD